jgi:hypothetical protein
MNRSNSSYLRDRRRIIRQVWHDDGVEYDAMHVDTENDMRPNIEERKLED